MLWKYLLQCIPTIQTKPIPIRLHQKDCIEVFPKEKLVLLCPHSQNVLEKFDSKKHYIIGAIVDRGNKRPMTLAKAREQGLETARLPVDSYRRFNANKTLTLDQIMSIMLEIKFSGDWNKAFEYIAKRKLK